MKEKVFSDPEIGQVRIVKSARGRRIGIRVHPSRGVSVSVPYFLRYDDGMRFFIQKRDWVKEAVLRQRKKMDDARRAGGAVEVLRDGVTVRTLLSEICFHRSGAGAAELADGCRRGCGTGSESPRRQSVTVSSSIVEDVRQTGRLYLSPVLPLSRKEISYPDSMPPEGSEELSGMLGRVLVEILRDEARSLLPQKLSFLAARYGFSYGRVAIKHNATNWGSCSTKGNINLNLNLVRLPEPICDYVLLHELCHLRYPNHGPEFHALLERLCGDNMKRLSFLVDSLQESPGRVPQGVTDNTGTGADPTGGATGERISKEYFHGLLARMRRSRARFPVHHVLEQEVKKYRLI